MDNDFTASEIKEAITAARIFSLDYGQEQFQALRELERRLQDSGYVEAVGAIARFEQERGIRCTEVLDAAEQLLSEKEQLEAEVATLEEKRTQCQQETQQAEEILQEVKMATEQVKVERERGEKELATFRRKSERERQRINEELEQCRQESKVTKEDIVTAGQLKAEVEKHGFTLELALGLSQEFAGYEHIRDKVAEALKEGQTLTKYNERAEGQQNALQANVKALEVNRQQLEGVVSQLRADEAFEKEIRGFYHRYQAVGPLMEHLTTWRGIFLVRCTNPLFADRFWTERAPLKRCPCCNYPDAVYDVKLYQQIGVEPGTPVQLKLEE